MRRKAHVLPAQLAPQGPLQIGDAAGTRVAISDPFDAQPAPRNGPKPIKGDQAKAARLSLNLDVDGLARLMGVSRRSVFEWEAKGVLSGPACVVYEMILAGELPARFVPLEDAQGRVYPVTI